MTRFIIALLSSLFVQILFAQNIAIENFRHHKRYFWQINSTLPVDKAKAVLVLKTNERGFEFKTPKNDNIETIESDEGIVLKIPDKTRYLIIRHPDFGSFDWRVPVKYLKKSNYYTADLITSDLTSEYNNPNQWLIFNISPENSILTVDSTMHKITNGTISLYMPLGKHTYKIESPFYKEISDSITLTDSVRVEKHVFLEPIYSYLSVTTDDPGVMIFVDDNYIGNKDITIGKISEGSHRLSILKNNLWLIDTIVNIENAEKKTLTLNTPQSGYNSGITNNDIPNYTNSSLKSEKKDTQTFLNELRSLRDTLITAAEIRLTTEDSTTNIFVDREYVGTGEWVGQLAQGFHLITTEKDNLESVAQILHITDSTPQNIRLVVPESSVGMFNINGNVTGAEVFINEERVGIIPCVLKGLTAEKETTLLIKKDGFKTATITARPKRNGLTDVYVKLQKE